MTYLLGFYPDPDSLDGKFHQLKVQVKRPGLEVRCRRGYYAIKNSLASESVSLDNLATALWSPLESSTIALEAEIHGTDPSKPNLLDIRWTVDVSTLHLAMQKDIWQGAINVLFIQQDVAGRGVRVTTVRGGTVRQVRDPMLRRK